MSHRPPRRWTRVRRLPRPEPIVLRQRPQVRHPSPQARRVRARQDRIDRATQMAAVAADRGSSWLANLATVVLVVGGLIFITQPEDMATAIGIAINDPGGVILRFVDMVADAAIDTLLDLVDLVVTESEPTVRLHYPEPPAL